MISCTDSLSAVKGSESQVVHRPPAAHEVDASSQTSRSARHAAWSHDSNPDAACRCTARAQSNRPGILALEDGQHAPTASVIQMPLSPCISSADYRASLSRPGPQHGPHSHCRDRQRSRSLHGR